MDSRAILAGARVSVVRDEIVVVALIILWVALAYGGWLWCDRLPPSTGRQLGYWIGITGAAQMLLLLTYPIRKRGVPIPGSIGFWFRTHMVLGLTGPLLVLFHSRYEWRAMNSMVALAATLVVMASGIVGRFLHLHLYRGYALHRLRADDLLAEVELTLDRLAHDIDVPTDQQALLASLAARVKAQHATLIGAAVLRLGLSVQTRIAGYRLRRAIDAEIDRAGGEGHPDTASLRAHHRQAAEDLDAFLRSIRTAGAFTLYERLFSWWHLFHLPLFGLLILAATLHVYAVHRY